MPAVRIDWTVDMLDALPDDGMYARLREYLRPSTIARAMFSASDVWRSDRKRNRVQPDVFGVR